MVPGVTRTPGTRFRKRLMKSPYFRLFFSLLNDGLGENCNNAFPAVSGWFRVATIQKLYNHIMPLGNQGLFFFRSRSLYLLRLLTRNLASYIMVLALQQDG
jgi:hypothetical protein